MIIHNLTEQSEYYTSNVWHICGQYNTMTDCNTLIDTGRDPEILNLLTSARCGLGKHIVEQIILTHSHFDHAGMLSALVNSYHPNVYAHPASRIEGIIPLSDRMKIQVGEQECTIVFTPGHSEDSICVLCEEEHLLFSGDIPIRVYSDDSTFTRLFVDAFELFAASELKVVYPGHGDPITYNVPHLIDESLRNIHHSQIV
ncbi:MBL fold metallo-hydrolase [Methanospirillum stamsii]|uniref:Metallo-beta-lactamase domain-containing protein n=1 Tax=Methanospirillum stamsii TaxID=1277351 RepID=A0A2V2N4V2_9EURY|nr:MBL fold metallo-hydrolase [Methanospirillum stamsii]PWR75114.1 hypothetical protein DLD82_06515 [Methanospirillum stamsii]